MTYNVSNHSNGTLNPTIGPTYTRGTLINPRRLSVAVWRFLQITDADGLILSSDAATINRQYTVTEVWRSISSRLRLHAVRGINVTSRSSAEVMPVIKVKTRNSTFTRSSVWLPLTLATGKHTSCHSTLFSISR